MQAINWQQFGLKSNPYDTNPLIEGGDLEMETAFIGREKERVALDALFDQESHLALVVSGDVGVGKTSLANFHKYTWKSKTPKLLFSFRREIEACDDLLDKRNFLIEIIASTLREIRLLEPSLLKTDPLQQLNALVDITQTLAISADASAGFGGYQGGLGFSKQGSTQQPLKISTTALESTFLDLISYIKNHSIGGKQYSGLIVHVNNFDVLLNQVNGTNKARVFFDEIRDILQTRDVYFLFLGPKTFYKDVIAHSQRVKSIFAPAPLNIEPLTKTEVVEALEKRMEQLKSPDVKEYIKPVDNAVIFKLYDLYQGDMRSIMLAIKDILGQYPEKLAKVLSIDEALLLLGRERWDRIEQNIGLKKEQLSILEFLVKSNKDISQKEVSVKLGKRASNVSSYYFKPLKEHGIIEEKRTEGNTVYYGLTTDYEPLTWFFISKQEVEKEIVRDAKYVQASLFEAE